MISNLTRQACPRTKRVRLPLAILMLAILASWTFAARRERLIESWRPINYNVTIALDDQLTAITSGKAEITIQSLKDNLSLIDFDFGVLSVDSVTVDSQDARFEHSNGRLNVTVPTPK